MTLNAKQVEQLLRPVNPRRVQKDRSGMSHLAAYDVSAHLTRIFGFGGWEKRIRTLELVSEESVTEGKRTGWWVTYRCQMTLVVKDPSGAVIWENDDGATGSASNLPVKGDAHDFALKNAISYALKRCAKDLGDQFGLSLYNKGSMDALVGRTLDLAEAAADVEKDIPELHPDTDDMQQQPEAEPERPAPAAVNGNGHAPAGSIEKPAQAPKPSRDEVDEDAQPFAEEASECRTVAALGAVNVRAREAHKTSALIRNPATGGTGGLGQYIHWKRRQLEDVEKALTALMDAASASGATEDIEARVLRMTGVSIEAATAAQLRDAAAALAKAPVPA